MLYANLQGNPDDVIELTDSNFDSMVMGSDDMWLVEFFAPWCGHCKNLAPEWASAATQLKGRVKVAAVDATVHSIVAGKYGVRQDSPIPIMFGFIREIYCGALNVYLAVFIVLLSLVDDIIRTALVVHVLSVIGTGLSDNQVLPSWQEIV